MAKLNKEQIAEQLGIAVEEITNEDIALANQNLEDRGLEQFELGDDDPLNEGDKGADDTIDANGQKIGDGGEYVLPEHVKDRYVSTDILSQQYYPRELIDSDPLNNPDHPLYERVGKVVKDNISAARKAQQELSEARKEQERLKSLTFGDGGQQLQNDPDQNIYGGISYADVEMGEAALPEWLKARDTYQNGLSSYQQEQNKVKESEAQRQERQRQIDEDHERQKAEVRTKYEVSDDEFTKMDKHLREQGVDPEMGYFGWRIRQAGGLEAFEDSAYQRGLADGKKTGRGEVVQTISDNLNKDSDPAPYDGSVGNLEEGAFKFKTAAEINAMVMDDDRDHGKRFENYMNARSAAVKRGDVAPI